MPVGGLDEACGTCGKRSGDHTLDEWAVCLGTPTTNLSFAAEEALEFQLALGAAA